MRYLFTLLIAVSAAARAQSIELVRAHFEGHRYPEARRELATLKTAEASYYLGRISQALNESDDAIEHFERAVELEPAKALYHAWLGFAVRDATPYVSKLKMPFSARRMKKELERAVELDPEMVDARFGLVQFHAFAPGAMGGSKDKAKFHAAELAKRSPMRGALARAVIAENMEQKGEAEAAFREALAASPDSLAAYDAFAVFLAQQGRADDAIAILDRYAQRRPDDRAVLFHVGRVAAISGSQLDRGEAALKDFVATPPRGAFVVTLAGAQYRLGQIAENRGDKALARERYTRAVQLNPRSPAKKALDNIK